MSLAFLILFDLHLLDGSFKDLGLVDQVMDLGGDTLTLLLLGLGWFLKFEDRVDGNLG
jgi:hypothetical protein